MKKTLLYIMAAVALIVAGCDNNIPAPGTVNNALVTEVVLDDVLLQGLTIDRGKTLSIHEYISALPFDATNFAQYYESSDPTVADVTEEGVLEAKSIGHCDITVYVGTDGISATFSVEVVRPDDIAITQLRFNSDVAEYDRDELKTVNIRSILYVGSESDTEDATENILFSSSNGDVATIDADGVVTIKGLGETEITAQAEFSQSEGKPISATVKVRIFKWVEHERYPGDLEGQQREIMAEDWNKLPHTDGGWTLSDFGAVEQLDYDWNAGLGARNCYRYAMLDGRRIEKRTGGAANDLPTATNGTAFAWSRPGGNSNDKENKSIFFVIDMQESLPVHYFRFVNISNDKDDRGVFVTKVSELYGSNDGTEWTLIASGLENFNVRSTPTHVAGTTYLLETEKAEFNNDVPYRYIKFLLKKNDCCIGFYGTDGKTDKTGGSPQIAELYMGYKAYSE